MMAEEQAPLKDQFAIKEEANGYYRSGEYRRAIELFVVHFLFM